MIDRLQVALGVIVVSVWIAAVYVVIHFVVKFW